MNKKPSTLIPILYAVASAALFVLANQTGTTQGIYVILNVAGTAFAIAFLLETVMLAGWIAVSIREENRRIAVQTPESLILSIIARMTGTQLAVLEKNVPAVLVTGGNQGPRFELKTPGGNVPFEAVREFFKRSPNGSIAPIRAYSEGSAARQYAQWLTDYFVFHGFARASAGNQSAQWLDRTRALQFIGLVEDEEE